MTFYDSPFAFDTGIVFDGVIPTPLPDPQIPVATPNRVTYKFTDLYGNLVAVLPLRGVTFSLALNAAGSFSATLDVEDPKVADTNWIEATQPWLNCVWVDINGALVWGGVITVHDYSDDTFAVQLAATDFYGYLLQRLQAKDYSTQWATNPAGAAQMAEQIISDALGSANSLSIDVVSPQATPSAYAITLAAPLSQRMSVDSLVSMLGRLGYLVGFDFACDVKYASGIPTGSISLSYPRRGREAGSTGLTIIASAGSGIKFRYTKDGTQQANVIAEMATGSGGIAATGTWETGMTVDGYPLLEKVAAHTAFSTTNAPEAVMEAYIADDLRLYAYPVVTPQVTMPLFADPAIGEWIEGDDVRVIIPKAAGGGPPTNPRFPKGMDFYWRIVKSDVVIADEGVSTVKHTLNMPPASTPQRPPL